MAYYLDPQFQGDLVCDYRLAVRRHGTVRAAAERQGTQVMTRETEYGDVVRFFRSEFPEQRIYAMWSVRSEQGRAANWTWRISDEDAAIALALKFG